MEHAWIFSALGTTPSFLPPSLLALILLGESGRAVAGRGGLWGSGAAVYSPLILRKSDGEVEMGGDWRWKFNVEGEVDEMKGGETGA